MIEFVQIALENWENCVEEFEKNLPDSLYYIYLLKNYNKYIKYRHGDELKIHRASLGPSEWVYVFSPYKIYDWYHVFTNCENITDELIETLCKYGVVDWFSKPYICGMEKHLWLKLEEKLKILHNLEAKFQQDCYIYWTDMESAKNYEIGCPEDVLLKPIGKEFSKLVTSSWVHTYEGCEEYVSQLLEDYGGFGIFSKTSNEILSWVLLSEDAGISMLHTLETSRRKGYGEVLVKAISKKMAEDGMIPNTFIDVTNEKSIRLFERLGFKRATNNYFVGITKEWMDRRT